MKSVKDFLVPDFLGALTAAKYIQGGLFVRQTKTQRNNIIYNLRVLDTTETTFCYVAAENVWYKLINNPTSDTTSDGDWDILDFGLTNVLTPVGVWDPTTNTPTLTDAGANGLNGNFYFVTNAFLGYTFMDTNLFGGATITVYNGDWVISVGTSWVVIRPTVTWDSISKPTVINDYVDGTVIAHTHDISDVTGLQTALDSKFDSGDVAESDLMIVAFDDVPLDKIVDVEFLKTYYYTSAQVDDIVIALSSSGWAVSGTTILAGSVLIQHTSVRELQFKDSSTNSLIAQFDQAGANATTYGASTIIWDNGTGVNSGINIIKGDFVGGTTPIGVIRFDVDGSITLSDYQIGQVLGVNIRISGTDGISVNDFRTTPTGIEYIADYSASYTSRSLVDKAYVLSVAGGGGDVFGPGVAVDNAIVRFDNTTGKLVQASDARILDVTSSNVVFTVTTGNNASFIGASTMHTLISGGNGDGVSTPGGNLYLRGGIDAVAEGKGNVSLLYQGNPFSPGVDFQSGEEIVHVSDAAVAPTGNPTTGYFMYSESSIPKFRTGGGKIITLDEQSAVTTAQGIADALTSLGLLASSTIVGL